MDIIKAMRLEIYAVLEKDTTIKEILKDKALIEKAEGWLAAYLHTDHFEENCNSIIQDSNNAQEINNQLGQFTLQIVSELLKIRG